MNDVTYGVRELRAHLGQALRAVKRGDRVVITSHGRPVAMMTKVNSSAADLDRKLLRLSGAGKLTLGKRGRIPDYAAPRISGLARQILEDRR